MSEHDVVAAQFKESGSHLQAVAHRMLGSVSAADDAVQEAWLRLGRSSTSDVDDFGAWLITVVTRVCLDMLRSRREESIKAWPADSIEDTVHRIDPAAEALLGDSVGPALLVVLQTVTPTERLAFVLHDMFAVPFDDIARILGCSQAAARQHANGARRQVQGLASSAHDHRRHSRDDRSGR